MSRRALIAGPVLAGLGVAAAGVARAVVATGDTVLLPTLTDQRIEVVTRAGWGCDEALTRNRQGVVSWPVTFFPAQAITVHHTSWVAPADRAQGVREVFQFHTLSRGWGDIGYQLVIDPEGRVYQGRSTGPGGVPVYRAMPSPGSWPQVVRGGHVYGFNAGNIGICLLGDFDVSAPTPAALDSLVRVIAALCYSIGLNPIQAIRYVSLENGNRADLPAVVGHRDWPLAETAEPTSCPGNALYGCLGGVRVAVGATLATMQRRTP